MTPPSGQPFPGRHLFLCLLLLVVPIRLAVAAEPARQKFDVPADVAERSLKKLSEQSGLEVIFSTAVTGGVRTNAVQGEYPPLEAVNRMLTGTNLEATQQAGTGAIVVSRKAETPEKNAPRAALAKNSDRPEKAGTTRDDATVVLETFEVMGRKLLNMDLPRSRDDVQPYVVFNRATIEQSGADNLEGFLKDRLTANLSAVENAQGASFGAVSTVNLRALGAGQTLVLVDGHRTANFYGGAFAVQGDLNGIPVAAVERIEILPTTASGIYGGSATGGVVNVILRRNYSGFETKLTYQNSFDTDTAVRRLDFNAGLTVENGRTNLLFAGMASDAHVLTMGDRPYFVAGRKRVFANNPASILSAANPPLGASTNLRSANGSPLFGPGSPNYTFVPPGYAGGGGLAPLQANAGRYDLDLAARSATSQGGARYGMRNGPRVLSLSTTIRRQFLPGLQVFMEASGSNNTGRFPLGGSAGTFTLAANAPNNPFGQAINVNVPYGSLNGVQKTDNYDRRLLGGVIVKMPRNWQAEADYTWDRFRSAFFTNLSPSTAARNAISSGTIDVLRDPVLYPLDLSAPANYVPNFLLTPFYSTMYDLSARVSGPIGALPGGSPTLSALVERRRETYSEAFLISGTSTLYLPAKGQAVDSASLQLTLPLVAAAHPRGFVRELELQASGRFDRYAVAGTPQFTAGPGVAVVTRAKVSSTNPTLGFKLKPSESVMLRASYGAGFLPPNVSQLSPGATSTSTGGGVDPKRGFATLGAYTVLTGGNSALRPEESKSYSAGVVLTPSFLPGIRAALDFTDIRKTDNISTLSVQQVLDNEDILPGRVQRGTPAAGDSFRTGPVTLIDRTMTNVSTARVQAYDLAIDYRLERRTGATWGFYVAATWQPHFKQQLAPTVAEADLAGIAPGGSAGIPVKFKANAGITWARGNWSAGWTTRYFDSYQVAANPTGSGAPLVLSQGGLRVSDQTYHDVFVGYQWRRDRGEAVSRSRRWLGGSSVQLALKNAFDTKIPFDASTTFGYASPFGDPRDAMYQVSWKKTF